MKVANPPISVLLAGSSSHGNNPLCFRPRATPRNTPYPAAPVLQLFNDDTEDKGWRQHGWQWVAARNRWNGSSLHVCISRDIFVRRVPTNKPPDGNCIPIPGPTGSSKWMGKWLSTTLFTYIKGCLNGLNVHIDIKFSETIWGDVHTNPPPFLQVYFNNSICIAQNRHSWVHRRSSVNVVEVPWHGL